MTADTTSVSSSAGQNSREEPTESSVGQWGTEKPSPPIRCTRPSMSASGFGSGGRNSVPSRRSPSYTYAAYIAVAALAKLTTPDPR
jgi:hypothetical protein